MIEIRYVKETDKSFWYSLDKHLSKDEFLKKVRDKQGYVLFEDSIPKGILRYGLFWDNIPFCNILYIKPDAQKCGFGKKMMVFWEKNMRSLGYGMVLLSTQVNEEAQHFYRKTGYKDCGTLTIDIPGFEQPMEMFMCKQL